MGHLIEVEILHVTQKGIRLKPTFYRQSSIKTFEKYMLVSTLGIWGM